MTSDESKFDPLAEGFRQPPDRVTTPCLTYMARVMELRDFINFYFDFVKTSAALGRFIPEAERGTLSIESSSTIIRRSSPS